MKLQIEEMCQRIEKLLTEKEQVIIVVEGSSASGKTTLAEMLEKRYEANVFHMDDFFLQPYQRTRERLEEAGGNVDRERFMTEVLTPLTNNCDIQYRRYDCKTKTILEAIEMKVKKLNIVEGSYGMHQEFGKYYDLAVFLDISGELQKERILKRNTPEMAERFLKEWIPMERKYQEAMEIREKCDFVINVEENRKVKIRE